ncbi:polymorphic toxin-type HINT domain-containing protein [Paenibacillus filicis]|uniref:Polymorphic toxin-type HINT domain-containing protein n=1 Tax=Paenibacillus gyeongsangnamensis TaxID=3388067 RepID=A0ABT4QDI5_9BACL|nr:polymorphic toxin-type HINT domain-containing protein [Paenibacillus filicis]MCZ8514932.1 polymorphic toxin-type HINT domain-containing protein [Paenibacillus filicis]
MKDKGWTFVKDLKVGDLLVQSDGNTLKVDSIVLEQKHATVYNMTVDEFHTYFVSDLGIWVHNTGACNFTFPKSGKDMKKVFGIDEKTFHKEVKPEVLKQIKNDPVYGKEFKKTGNNPDIGVDDLGNIVLKDVRTGKTLQTDWSFESFLP